MSSLRYLRASMEEQSDGQAHREREHTLYARINDFGILKNAASMEHQEQWEVKVAKTEANAGEGKFRVRKTIENGRPPEYVVTCKTKAGTDAGDNMEVSVPTTEAMFQQFKILSEAGMVKDRYFFPVEGSDLVWEVDMFYRKGAQPGSGEYEPWCKIDLEVSDMSLPLPSLPDGFSEVIANPFGKRTEQEELRVVALYHNEFVAPNPYLKQ